MRLDFDIVGAKKLFEESPKRKEEINKVLANTGPDDPWKFERGVRGLKGAVKYSFQKERKNIAWQGDKATLYGPIKTQSMMDTLGQHTQWSQVGGKDNPSAPQGHPDHGSLKYFSFEGKNHFVLIPKNYPRVKFLLITNSATPDTLKDTQWFNAAGKQLTKEQILQMHIEFGIPHEMAEKVAEANDPFRSADPDDVRSRQEAARTEAEKALLGLAAQALEHILAAQTAICSLDDEVQFSMDQLRDGTAEKTNEYIAVLDDVNDELHPLRDKLEILLGISGLEEDEA